MFHRVRRWLTPRDSGAMRALAVRIGRLSDHVAALHRAVMQNHRMLRQMRGWSDSHHDTREMPTRAERDEP